MEKEKQGKDSPAIWIDPEPPKDYTYKPINTTLLKKFLKGEPIKKEVKSMEEKGEKEKCWFCREELPYNTYKWTKRNWNAQPTGIETKTVLNLIECSELEIQVILQDKTLEPSQKTYAHIPCAQRFFEDDQKVDLLFSYKGYDGKLRVKLI